MVVVSANPEVWKALSAVPMNSIIKEASMIDGREYVDRIFCKKVSIALQICSIIFQFQSFYFVVRIGCGALRRCTPCMEAASSWFYI